MSMAASCDFAVLQKLSKSLCLSGAETICVGETPKTKLSRICVPLTVTVAL